jgi:hypothetical protein
VSTPVQLARQAFELLRACGQPVEEKDRTRTGLVVHEHDRPAIGGNAIVVASRQRFQSGRGARFGRP